ncbi:MAG: alkaline phosphatase family protein [Peptococcaceae bacterium]|nr:alkaline phosphatase family protein [Peptococcaceae bacterium]
MNRKALSDKVLVLGVDGMDPRLTRKYVDEGLMPNTKQFIERGAQRHDLMMLGGAPTVTPPMWTTLATGCYANVHGITGFFRCGNDIDEIAYNLDSKLCKAEQVWNTTAEAGLKTLVFHWPGSSWPPTSESENLYVIDGTTPGVVGQSSCAVDTEFVVAASEKFEQVRFVSKPAMEATAACVIEDLEIEDNDAITFEQNTSLNNKPWKKFITKIDQSTTQATEGGIDQVRSPIKPAKGWANAPEGAKEFTILYSQGMIRRPALILKNKQGIYDRVAVYNKKSDEEPLVICEVGKLVKHVPGTAVKGDETFNVIRNLKLLKLAEDGSTLNMHVSYGMDTENDTVWHPKRLFQEVKEEIGTPVPFSFIGHQEDMLITDCMLDNWYDAVDYQAEVIKFLIEKENLDVVFSHMHNVDIQEHMFIKFLADIPSNKNGVEMAQKWIRNLYIQTDYYLGQFLPLLDKGWTILIVSDHAQVAPKHDVPLFADANASVITPIMEELGYTVLKRDENGNKLEEVDWTKTRAIVQREGMVYLNLKGRNKHTLEDGTVIDGIVDPGDQYELEEQIMTDLYGYKDPKTGHRIFSVALRNRDAILLGNGGPEAGDILVWHAEGYNFDHADCLSTTYGEGDTSVSPIFIAAGKGIKKGYETERIIREVDVAPTICLLTGARMPRNCEGAPVYQIFEEEV